MHASTVILYVKHFQYHLNPARYNNIQIRMCGIKREICYEKQLEHASTVAYVVILYKIEKKNWINLQKSKQIFWANFERSKVGSCQVDGDQV